MATGTAQMMLQCIFNGSLSMQDKEIERRPYHRNCSYALHKSKGVCSNPCPQQSKSLFPKKQSWTNYSLSTAASKLSGPSSLVDKLLVRNKEDANGTLPQKIEFIVGP